MRPLPLPAVVKVVGVSFHQDVVRTVRPEQIVVVKHDPHNPYDSNACAVLTDKAELLGHVPAPLAQRLILRDGDTWDGVVTEVLPGETWGLRVRIQQAGTAAPAAAAARDPETFVQALSGAQAKSNRPRPAVEPDDSAAASDDTDETAGLWVFSPSGRALGRLLRTDGDRVWVRSARSGTAVTYPASAVQVRGSSDAA